MEGLKCLKAAALNRLSDSLSSFPGILPVLIPPVNNPNILYPYFNIWVRRLKVLLH